VPDARCYGDEWNLQMSDPALRRADELLTELVELIETARALPMSSSCVVPREQVLDLLDGLREVMPPEMAQARGVVAHRDSIEAEAAVAAADLAERARAEADRLVHAARVEAHETAEAARAEAARLVSTSSIHQTAVAEAQAMRADAEDYVAALRAEGERYAGALRRNGERYADQTLSDLIDLLTQAARTAENGRRALNERAAAAEAATADDLGVSQQDDDKDDDGAAVVDVDGVSAAEQQYGA
jgi:hypothetical protein